MMKVHKWISSCFGIGFIKGGGTIAALVTCVVLWLIPVDSNDTIMIALTVAVCIVGVVSSHMVEKDWGKDSSRVVIDEVAGMCVSLVWVPFSIQWILAALVLFRFFDIAKPLYIRRAEALPGGWGVMADDILAGVYSNIVLQVVIFFV